MASGGPPATIREATRVLAGRDPVMARLVATHRPCRLAGRRTGTSRFEQLAEAIAYQQLAGRAAAAIWARVVTAVGEPFTPEAVLAAGPGALRAAGFSAAKTASLLDLAARVADGSVRLARIGRLSDEEVVAELSRVRGIGRWTAEMFLIFTLHRLDVWPTTDLGVRVGYARAYGLAEPPPPAELAGLGDVYRPYRTVAAWYCWRECSP